MPSSCSETLQSATVIILTWSMSGTFKQDLGRTVILLAKLMMVMVMMMMMMMMTLVR